LVIERNHGKLGIPGKAISSTILSAGVNAPFVEDALGPFAERVQSLAFILFEFKPYDSPTRVDVS
jgi:hypothetical protein